MSRATTTHQEKPASEKSLVDRVTLSETAARLAKQEVARVRTLTADLFFANSEKVIDAETVCR